jgi:group I intron endonuclease
VSKDVICGIYKIISPSGKIYIGQAVNINKRWKKYMSLHSSVKGQIILYRSFLKHEVNKHIFEVIEECDSLQLNNRERHWQDFYDVLGENGLNCKLQSAEDKKMILSKEAREKISKANSKEGNAMFGLRGDNFPYKKFFGEENPWFGSKHSEETKRKMREGHKAADRKVIKGSDHPFSKKVIDTISGIVYDCLRDASKKNDISYHTLQKKLSGVYKNNTTLKYLTND